MCTSVYVVTKLHNRRTWSFGIPTHTLKNTNSHTHRRIEGRISRSSFTAQQLLHGSPIFAVVKDLYCEHWKLLCSHLIPRHSLTVLPQGCLSGVFSGYSGFPPPYCHPHPQPRVQNHHEVVTRFCKLNKTDDAFHDACIRWYQFKNRLY